jgi:hypothetical protein
MHTCLFCDDSTAQLDLPGVTTNLTFLVYDNAYSSSHALTDHCGVLVNTPHS